MLYCIDDNYNGGKVNLTIGNSYKVLYKQNFEVFVINDKGKKAGYGINRFADKAKHREMQLEKLLNNN
jgi:hypothetical protein